MGQYIPYIIDGLLILFLIIRFVRGYNKGFIREVFSLILNVGSIVLLVLYLNPLRELLVKYIDIAKLVGKQSNAWVNYLLSMSRYLVVTLVILLAFWFVTTLLTLWTKKWVQRVRDDHPGFASFDKTFGFVFGLVNGVITLVIICYLAFQPVFLPQGQEYLNDTQFAKAVYDITEDTLETVTKKDKDEINEIVIKYLLGTELQDSTQDELKANSIALLIKNFPTLVSKPYKLLEGTGDKAMIAYMYIWQLSALADLTAKVPEDEELDKRFGIIYDQLVDLLPEGLVLNLTELEYNIMFDEKTGTFYQVGLSQEQINKIQNLAVKTPTA